MASITSLTTDGLMFGAGTTISIGGTSVGALAEGESAVVTLEMEIVERAPLGSRGPLANATRIRKAVPMLAFTAAEILAFNMALAFSGLGNSSAAASMAYGSSGAIGTYADGDYKSIVLDGIANGASESVELHFLDALMTAPPEMNFGDDSVLFAMTYRAHYDDANPEVLPMYLVFERGTTFLTTKGVIPIVTDDGVFVITG